MASKPRPTTIIMDYQNVHLVAAEKFLPNGTPRHEALLHPMKFAETLVEERNRALGERFPHELPAELACVVAYRGLPSSQYAPHKNAWNLKQKARWDSDRVTVVHRPLRYDVATTQYSIGYDGRSSHEQEGLRPREKGIDVLCALATVQHARRPGGLVILASHDSDLEPAIDFARAAGGSKVEGFQWHGGNGYGYRLKSRTPGFWVTSLNSAHFTASLDPERLND